MRTAWRLNCDSPLKAEGLADVLRGLFDTGFRTDKLRTVPRPGFFALFFSIALLLFLVQFARLIWAVVTPVSPVGDWHPASAVVLSPETQLALFNSFDPFSRALPQDAGQAVVTSLPVELFGILVNGSSGLGSAIIAGSDGVQISYAVGEEIQPGVTLASVAFDYVVLSRGGAQERIYIDQSVPAKVAEPGAGGAVPGPGGPPAPAVTAPSVSGATVSGAGNPPRTVANMQKYVGFSPRAINGKISGVVAAPGSNLAGFRAMGFLPGDIITAVNGRKIASASDAAFVQQQIKPGARLSLLVERGADTVPISLNLEQ